ncbi:unnamed protein product [Effrenium voratum]|nr:unnamed protein product [Effrenium voratum]
MRRNADRKEHTATYVLRSSRAARQPALKSTTAAQTVFDQRCAEGMFRVPRKCEKCFRGKYGRKVEPVAVRKKGCWHVSVRGDRSCHYVARCGERACRHRLNVMACGPWPKRASGMLTMDQADKLLDMWETAKVRPPSPRTVASALHCSRWAANWFMQYLTQETGTMAQRQSARDCPPHLPVPRQSVWEIDGTGIGKYYVSPRSQTRRPAMRAWAASYGGRMPKYFQCHTRILGVTSRTSGCLFLACLPEKLIPPLLG